MKEPVIEVSQTPTVSSKSKKTVNQIPSTLEKPMVSMMEPVPVLVEIVVIVVTLPQIVTEVKNSVMKIPLIYYSST